MKIWLFDLDGVLVIPGGYSESLKRTVGHFATEMDFSAGILRGEDIEAFEARGMTCEWDISAVCVAAMAYSIWKANSTLRLPPSLPDAWKALQAPGLARPAPAFSALARVLAEARPAPTPSHAAFDHFRGEARTGDDDSQRAAEIEVLLSILLGHPRDAVQSPVLRYFQHLTLGSRVFAEHYGVPEDFNSPSLLEELDQPALSSRARDALRLSIRGGHIHAAVLTNRPSRPALPDAANSYAPEAELALRAAGLDFLPLMGSGHMLWLSQRHGQHEDAYCKPSAVHALAAIGSALGSAVEAALEAGRLLWEEGRLAAPLAELRKGPAVITVFEDSSTGVFATRSAADALRKAGVETQVRVIGIATEGEKRRALESMGADVFSGIDDALAAQGEEQQPRID